MNIRTLLVGLSLLCCVQLVHAQNTTLGEDSITVIGNDTIIGPPITFRTYDSRFVDFMFFDGNYNIVVFQINENHTCFQFMLSSEDSAYYCFQVTDKQFKELMRLVDTFKSELEKQKNWPVKCNYCQTLQMFWYDKSHEYSTLKKNYAIPQSFSEILDYCYDISTTKRKCDIDMNQFKSLEGFKDNLRGPSSAK
ncbi:MAG: hypothetical protein R2794_09015 [Chitinophagales bacterium]